MSKLAGTRGPVRNTKWIEQRFGGDKFPKGQDADDWITLFKSVYTRCRNAGFEYDCVRIMSDKAFVAIAKLIRDDGAIKLAHISEA